MFWVCLQYVCSDILFVHAVLAVCVCVCVCKEVVAGDARVEIWGGMVWVVSKGVRYEDGRMVLLW